MSECRTNALILFIGLYASAGVARAVEPNSLTFIKMLFGVVAILNDWEGR
jgi:hypothetical protein